MNEKIYNEILNYIPFDEKEEKDKKVMLEYIKNNEDVLTRNNEIVHMTVSAWIVNKDKTKVLMIHHNIYNSWSWIGGHADGDDDFLRVAKKEVEEETGVTKLNLLTDKIYGLNIVTVENHIKRGKQVNAHLHFDIEYLFEADENDEIRIKEDENSGVKWIDINEVIKYTTEEKMKSIYIRLIDKLETM